MMKILQREKAWEFLSEQRTKSAVRDKKLEAAVADIIEAVRERGDGAVRELAARFGDEVPEYFILSEKEKSAAVNRLDEETRKLLERAAGNIRAFADEIMKSFKSIHIEYAGWNAGLDFRPVRRVACYVPGGRYPLPSTALMTAITAQAAGVEGICIASPEMRDEIVYAGRLAGIENFYRMGGAQAIAALALGTETIKQVDMIAGPGNAYVTEAKRQLQGVAGIDMLAGPTEVAIIADSDANPGWVALDILAQLEHDPGARSWLFTDSLELARRVTEELDRFLEEMGLPEFVRESLPRQVMFIFESLPQCARACNLIAPEHLELQVAKPELLKEELTDYGALFMGYKTAVSLGDYMAGPNHTLPTGGTSRFSGALSPLTFLRPQSWIKVTGDAESLYADTDAFAQVEGLPAHSESTRARFS